MERVTCLISQSPLIRVTYVTRAIPKMVSSAAKLVCMSHHSCDAAGHATQQNIPFAWKEVSSRHRHQGCYHPGKQVRFPVPESHQQREKDGREGKIESEAGRIMHHVPKGSPSHG